MHVRTITMQVQPGKLDEFVRIAQEQWTVMLPQQPGLQGFLLLTDRATNSVSTVSRWDTEATMLASEQSDDFRAGMGAVRPLTTGVPRRETYQVALALGQWA